MKVSQIKGIVAAIVFITACFNTTNAQTLAAGSLHSLVICSDSTVMDWGSDYYGQLGDSTMIQDTNALACNCIPSPVHAYYITKAIAVSGGDRGDYTGGFSVALKSDGTVWAWGNNDYGQLGDGTIDINRIVPVQVPLLSNIIAISAGGDFTLALRNDSTVWSWGNGALGQLGDTSYQRSSPAQVPGLSSISAIAAGGQFALALKNDGTVWSWGSNDSGQLGFGNDSINDSTNALQVLGLTNVVSIAAGFAHAFAIRNDGSLWGWGANDYGEVGDSTTNPTVLVPELITRISNVKAISAGFAHTVAIKNDETLWTWGWNFYGQLGDSTNTDEWVPQQAPWLYGIISIACGDDHTLAKRNDGTLWAWGYNVDGQLGDTLTLNNPSPTKVIGLCDIPSGIKQLTMNTEDATIAPNPFIEQTTITFLTTTQQSTTIKIMNILGKEVYDNVIPTGTNTFIIDKGTMLPGMYFVQITEGSRGVVNKKIMVQ